MRSMAALVCGAIALQLLRGAAGEWIVVEDTQALCEQGMLCTPSNFTWATARTYGSEDGCALLARKGIRELHMYGDSFVRHLYIGLVLTLTGNYKDGALQEGIHDCDYNAQFEEKRCRLVLRLTSTLCNDAVTMRYSWGNPPVEKVCEQPLPDSLVLWSIGNHPLTGYERPSRGQNDVPMHLALFEKEGMCPFAAGHPAQCRLWWVTTHQRLNTLKHGNHAIEGAAKIRDFNLGMREWFEAGECGPSHVVDVFNMTHTLVHELGVGEALPLTHDTVHWSLVVNAIKTQILLNDFEAELPSVDAVEGFRRRLRG